MARTRRPAPEPAPADQPEPANSVVASAATVSNRPPSMRPRNSNQEWQQQVWYFFDTVGELRFGVQWLANAMSRVTLGVQSLGTGDDGDDEMLEEGPAVDVLASLFGGEAGQSQMMAGLGLHLSVPGEAYLIGEPDETGGDDRWLIAATDEVTERGGKWMLDRGDGKRPVHPEALIIRIWRPHPRRWVMADSSCRAVLPVLREIENLTKRVAAEVDSRLAGAGVFAVPSEMTFASPLPEDETGDQSGNDPLEDPFLAALTEAMTTPLADRESAAAVVPIVVKAPGALLASMQHIRFSTDLSAQALELRQEAIRRLALGLDIPVEVVLGQGDSNHWSAWQIEESALKVHIEPMVELICSALTSEFLRPVLDADPSFTGDTSVLQVVGDTSDLRLRPDRSSQALDLYDRLELGGDALRRETGFEEEDAPDDDEKLAMLLTKLALGAIAPEVAQAALEAMGVDLSVPEPPEPPAPPTVVQVPAPEPATEPPPATPPPVESRRPIPEQEAAAALLATGEVLVLRALERANNKMNRRGKTRRPFTADACDLALADAWDHVPRAAALLGVDPGWMREELDRYTRALLTEGTDHTPTVLARVLAPTPVG